MKPPITYCGAKVILGGRIASLLPSHQHYVEPFAGSLAVLLAKPPSTMETVNDLDAEIMAFWAILRERPDDLERMCALTPHARAEHTAAGNPVPADHSDRELEQARRIWVRLSQGRGGTLQPTGWRHYVRPVGTTGMPRYLKGYVGRIAAAAERLAMVSLECRPALELIKSYGRHPEVLLYVDPPYLGSTRTSRAYRHEMPKPEQHAELAEALNGCASAVVLSGYHSLLYDDLYDGWHRHELAAGTGQAHRWSARTEVLWSNRPFPKQEEVAE